MKNSLKAFAFVFAGPAFLLWAFSVPAVSTVRQAQGRSPAVEKASAFKSYQKGLRLFVANELRSK